jgi:hypothetical protein
VPFTHTQTDIVVSSDAVSRLVLRDKDGTPLRVLTDKELREFSFDPNGVVIKGPKKT